MKRSYKLLGLAGCVLSMILANNVLADSPAKETFANPDESADLSAEDEAAEQNCHLFYLVGDFALREASMAAGEPIDTFHLFVTALDGKIIKNAQVIATIIDQQGDQQFTRALPYKGGYQIAIDQLRPGQYRVETEILTKGQLLTKAFRFNRA